MGGFSKGGTYAESSPDNAATMALQISSKNAEQVATLLECVKHLQIAIHDLSCAHNEMKSDIHDLQIKAAGAAAITAMFWKLVAALGSITVVINIIIQWYIATTP